MIKIYLASDHAGVELKSKIAGELMDQKMLKDLIKDLNIEVQDLGPQSMDSVDYPDYADLVCKKVHGLSLVNSNNEGSAHPAEVGILICGSGQGMCMRANKYPQIRAALCWSLESAKLSREHNDANVLCLSSRFVTTELSLQIVQTFLTTPFAGGRHSQRVVKLNSPIA